MKFVSKNINLRVVLRPGIPGNAVVGREPQPGLYVKFEGGTANVVDEEMTRLMLAHKGFGSDFIRVEANDIDPYYASRVQSEPEHNIIEMSHGTPGRNLNPQSKLPLSPELKKLVQEMAVDLAKKMVPDLVKATIESMVDKSKEKEESTPGKKIGRPKKTESTEVSESEADSSEDAQSEAK